MGFPRFDPADDRNCPGKPGGFSLGRFFRPGIQGLAEAPEATTGSQLVRWDLKAQRWNHEDRDIFYDIFMIFLTLSINNSLATNELFFTLSMDNS